MSSDNFELGRNLADEIVSADIFAHRDFERLAGALANL